MKKVSKMCATSVLLFTSFQVLAEECKNEFYIGSYQEDSVTNPEDPMPGSIRLSIPKKEGSFSGQLYFTYFGCQSSNKGAVTGKKQINDNSAYLMGSWSGSVDRKNQQGSIDGSYNHKRYYEGTYTVAGGKQHLVIEDCI